MKNAFSRILAGGILAAGSMFAGTVGEVTVTVTHAITIGNNTLPSGTYTISPIETSVGTEFFVLRGSNTAPIVMPVQKVEGEAASKTKVSFSEEGDTWRLEKLSVEGESTSYEFEK